MRRHALAERMPPAADGVAALAGEIRDYLSRTPKQLPSRYLYDALGSALFDAICELPWYPVTRAERRLLEAHAEPILQLAGVAAHVVELGAGNGSKLAVLLGAARGPQRPSAVHLIDVSAAALATASRAVAAASPARVATYEASYEAGLAQVRAATEGARRLVLFLGSNIGNFDPDGARTFVQQLHDALAPGDHVLLGADLVKPAGELVKAYDDPLGVTAAFNLNLLARLNHDLQGDFDLASFRHRAHWNEAAARVEMHLVSTRPQRVRLRRAGFEMTMRGGEHIWTESSYKYSASGVRALLVTCGFRVRDQWIDQPGQFALTLAGR